MILFLLSGGPGGEFLPFGHSVWSPGLPLRLTFLHFHKEGVTFYYPVI